MTGAVLRFRFLESGIGETIVIDFPDGQVGIVDAHPSPTESRPGLLEIVNGRDIAFTCLTHPHEDHGLGLIEVLQTQRVKEFWYSFSPVNKFVYYAGQHVEFRSPERQLAIDIDLKWAEFMADLLHPVAKRKIQPRSLNESCKPIAIGGVTVHFFAPSQELLAFEEMRIDACLLNPAKPPPDPNKYSLIMGFEFCGTLVLLGSDALRSAWKGARSSWRNAKLPAAIVLKVPHHGAKNAFDLRPANLKPLDCLDLCADKPRAVLFAGDHGHPDERVLQRLSTKTDLISLFSLSEVQEDQNPLRLRLPRVRSARKAPRLVEFSEVTVDVDSQGTLQVSRK